MTGRRRGATLALVATLALPACGADDTGPRPPVSDSVYVEVMARLVLLDSALAPRTGRGGDGDGALGADSLRRRVLDAWGVRAEELLDYAETRGTTPEHMDRIWQRIDELSDSLDAAGWSPAGAPGDSASAAGDTLRGT